MNYGPMLAPVVALVAWTLVMQVWMYATRFPALKRKGISLKGRRGGRARSWTACSRTRSSGRPTITTT